MGPAWGNTLTLNCSDHLGWAETQGECVMSIFDLGDRPKLNRRQSLQVGAAATAAGLLGAEEVAAPAQAASGGGDPSFSSGGYPTPPFVDEMPHLNLPPFVAQPVSPDSLVPTPAKGIVAGEAKRLPHRAWDMHPPEKYYELIEEAVQVSLHRDMPLNTMWGFRCAADPEKRVLVPGPTFHAKSGEPILVRIRNNLPLPSKHVGYGMPETSTHLHDNHNTQESDGSADDYYPKLSEMNPAHRDTGRFKDFHWINKPAGADPEDPTNPKKGDPTECMGTLWYHDHRHSFTSANTYRGLAGFYLVFDQSDNNNENAIDNTSLPARERPLKLPSGKYDVPLALADKMIDSSGQLVFDQLEMDGILGNKLTVNGKIQPFFKVERRRYRFRLLNAGPSRVFGLSLKVANNSVGDLRNATDYQHVFIVGRAGALLPRPLQLVGNPHMMMPAHRSDVVVDFKAVLPGQWLYLVNEYAQSNGNKPDGFIGNFVNGPQFKPVRPGIPMMRLDVQAGDVADLSASMAAPCVLRPLPEYPVGVRGVEYLSEATILAAVGKKNPFPSLPKIATVRRWRFDRTNGQWAVNNRLYDGEAAALCMLNTAELWVLENTSGGWVHPVHIHFEKFRVLYRANGLKPGPGDLQNRRSDTLSLGPNERAVIFIQFRDFTGHYLMHCHNTVHEDHAMMVRFDIVD